MDKIYEQAKDLHIVATYVYGNGTDTKAYTDAAFTKQFTVEELKEAFIKGALIKVGEVLYKAVSFNKIGAIYFVKEGTEGAATIDVLKASDGE